MIDVQVKIHDVSVDGLPDMENLTGRVAFIWDGAIVSGWPIENGFHLGQQMWEPSEDRFGGPVIGVTHWVEFPVPVWNLEKEKTDE